MMRVPVIYRKKNSRFEIDSCGPQVDAMRNGKIHLHALSHGLYPGIGLKASQLTGISSVGFWDGVNTQDWGLDPHRNEGVEICYLETGAMNFSVEGKKLPIRAGDFTLTRPWQLHKLGAPNIGPGKLHWLILDVGVRRPNQKWLWPGWLTLTESDRIQLTRKLRYNESAIWKASPTLASSFCGLSDCVLKWNNSFIESRAIMLLNQLFLELLRILSEQNVEEDPELATRRHTVKLFLNDLARMKIICDEEWSLPKMAAHCGMGITTFSKYCRELVNCGAAEYLTQCRIDNAAQELREFPSRPVIEIAFKNGFNSSQYFATAFRKRFKVSPLQFRRAVEGS